MSVPWPPLTDIFQVFSLHPKHMKPQTACLFAAWLLTSAALATEAPKPLLDKLRSLAGDSSQDCGVVLRHDRPDAAFACAEDAAASDRPYRLAVEFDGADGAGWQGAARDAQGKLWTLYF